MNVNTALLRQFLIEKFSADELTTFLFDYFSSVHDMTSGMSKPKQIQELLDHCKKHGSYPYLFDKIERERSGIFKRSDFTDDRESVHKVLTIEPSPITLWSNLKQISAWSLLILLVPFVAWGLWSTFDSYRSAQQNEIAALNATATARQNEAMLAARLVGEASVATSTRQPTKTATTAPKPSATQRPTETATSFPTPTLEFPPANAELGDRWVRPPDEMEMVFVPGGTFIMGSNLTEDPAADADEQPPHEVTLPSYWIDRTEVTNAQFAAFLNMPSNQEDEGVTWLEVDDEGVLIELEGNRFVPKFGFADHPVVEVSWYGARDYCIWSGGQLPTEAQWEFAARGEDGHLYPWGNLTPTCDLAQLDGCESSTVAVDSFPLSSSWVKAVNMAGNVWEWVFDRYNDNYYENAPTNEPPTGPSFGSLRVVRGGAFYVNQQSLRAANRHSAGPISGTSSIGFRCAYPPDS